MFQGLIKPLVGDGTKSPLSARQFIDPLRRVNPTLANAIERLQQAVDFTIDTLRKEPEQADEIVFTDAQGNVIFWVGSREGYFGGWFGQLYVGGTGPVNANLFVDNTGLLTIRDALITLTSGAKEIRLDPAGPTLSVTDTDASLSIYGTGNVVQIVGENTTLGCGVYIGTDGQIRLLGSATSPAVSISMTECGSVGGATLALNKSNGTPTAPTIVTAGDQIGGMEWRGYDGANYILSGSTVVRVKAAVLGAVVSSVTHSYGEYFFNVGGTDAIRILAYNKLVFGTGSSTTGFNVDFEGKVRLQSDVKIDGPLTLVNPTVSRPLKVNNLGLVKGEKISLDSANDVDITGASAGDVLQWDGSKVSVYTLAALATALETYFVKLSDFSAHTHNGAISQYTDDGGSPLHSHGISTFSTGVPV